MSLLGDELYSALGFYADDDESDHLHIFGNAWAATLEPVYEIVRDRDDGKPGWAIVFDPDEAPASVLPYSVQYVGVRIEPGWSEAQTRAEFASPTTWRRGRTDTWKTAIQATLTGSQRVIIRKRTPKPPDVYVRVLAMEAPSPARTEAVARSQKVGGLLMDFAVLEGVTLADLEAGWPESLEELEGAFSTLAEVEDLLPDELPEP